MNEAVLLGVCIGVALDLRNSVTLAVDCYFSQHQRGFEPCQLRPTVSERREAGGNSLILTISRKTYDLILDQLEA